MGIGREGALRALGRQHHARPAGCRFEEAIERDGLGDAGDHGAPALGGRLAGDGRPAPLPGSLKSRPRRGIGALADDRNHSFHAELTGLLDDEGHRVAFQRRHGENDPQRRLGSRHGGGANLELQAPTRRRDDAGVVLGAASRRTPGPDSRDRAAGRPEPCAQRRSRRSAARRPPRRERRTGGSSHADLDRGPVAVHVTSAFRRTRRRTRFPRRPRSADPTGRATHRVATRPESGPRSGEAAVPEGWRGSRRPSRRSTG